MLLRYDLMASGRLLGRYLQVPELCIGKGGETHILMGYPGNAQQSDVAWESKDHELSVIEYTLFLTANQMMRSGTTCKLTFVYKVSGHFQRQYNGPLPPRTRIGLRNRPCH